MRKIILLSFLTFSMFVQAQNKNKLHDQNFWKSNPTLEAVKTEISNGSHPSEMNTMDFDAVALAINNNASNDIIKYLLTFEGNNPEKKTNHSRTYLHWATARGNAEIVAHLILLGADINAQDSHFDTPLVFGVNAGMYQPEVFEVYAKKGVDLTQRNKNGATFMMLVAPYDTEFAATDYLANKGLSLRDTDQNGATVFDYAARTGNIATLKALLKKGVKPTGQALVMAAQGTRRAANTLEVYKYLIEELKLNAKTTDSDGNTLLHLIARKQNQTDLAEYLFSKGLNVNSTNKEGSNVLLVAAGGRDMDFIHLVLGKTTNINATNQKGESALTSAVTSGISETVELLLSKNADIQVKDVRGNHLGLYLIQSYRPVRGGFGPAGTAPAKDEFSEKMNILQAKGLNLALPQADKSTLYHLAAQKDDLNLFKKLAGLNIDVNAKNAEEMTVLHKVALTAHDDKILKYLLSIGAKKDIETEFGETAYDLAAQNEYLKNNKVDISFLK